MIRNGTNQRGPRFLRRSGPSVLEFSAKKAKMYRIKDWYKLFENNRTRELKRMDWVPVPNRMDGAGYTALVDHPNGAAHLGAWLAMLEISSRQTPRGTFPQEGAGFPQEGAGFPQVLARISRLPVQLFMEVIPRLEQIGWIERVTEIPQDGAGIPQEGAGIPQEGAVPSRDTRAVTEGNGRERKGTEGKRSPITETPPDENGGWRNARLFVDAWRRHLKQRRDQPEQVVCQVLIGRNGTVDWARFTEFHPAYCAYWDKRGWDFCPLTLLEWIDGGMLPPPLEVLSPKDERARRISVEEKEYFDLRERLSSADQ